MYTGLLCRVVFVGEWWKLIYIDEGIKVIEYRASTSSIEKSEGARLKASSRKNSDSLSVQSFNCLLFSLVSIRFNTCQVNEDTQPEIVKYYIHSDRFIRPTATKKLRFATIHKVCLVVKQYFLIIS